MEKDLSFRKKRPILTFDTDVVRLRGLLEKANEPIYDSSENDEGIDKGILGTWNGAVFCSSNLWCLGPVGDISLDEFEKLLDPKVSLKKEDVGIRVHTEEEMIRVREILQAANEPIYPGQIMRGDIHNASVVFYDTKEWMAGTKIQGKTPITIDELEQLLETKQKTKTMEVIKTVTRKALGEIYPIVCPDWQTKIKDLFKGHDFVEEFLIPEGLLKDAWKDVETSRQETKIKEWLTKNNLSKPEPQYKVGDWVRTSSTADGYGSDERLNNIVVKIESVDEDDRGRSDSPKVYFTNGMKTRMKEIARLATSQEIEEANWYPNGTPCLVRDCDDYEWKLRYANGKGQFYMNGRTKGDYVDFKKHQKLDINNLPVNP